MKVATTKDLKQELGNRSTSELSEICLKLSKFKKENKELLTYLLFEVSNEAFYINNTKAEIEKQFQQINTSSYYYMKKSIRKILKNTKTHIRYSKKKKTEVELLIHFCSELKKVNPTIKNNIALKNIFYRQIEAIKKAMSYLHEDLKYDYGIELQEINN